MRIVLLLVLFLITSTVLAQGWQVQPPANTPIAGTPYQNVNRASVDVYGNQLVKSTDPSTNLSESIVPISNSAGLNGEWSSLVGYDYAGALSDTIEAASTTTVLNLTAHAARVGDAVLYRGAVVTQNTGVQIPICSVTANSVTLCYPLPATPSTEAIAILRPTPVTVSRSGTAGQTALTTAMDINAQQANSSGLLKAEDATHASGDAGVVDLGIRNDSAVALSGTDLDYTVPVVNQYGGQVMDLDIRFQGNGTPSRSPIRAEDAVSASQDALMSAGAIVRSDVAANAADADYANINVDLDGRLYVNATGSGVSDYINGCSASAVTTNTTQTLVAADADERFYVTGFECQNTSGAAVATHVILEDGAGTDLARCLLPTQAAGGNCSVSIGDVPIRVANTNSLLQINVITTGSSTTCCVRGYKSPN